MCCSLAAAVAAAAAAASAAHSISSALLLLAVLLGLLLKDLALLHLLQHPADACQDTRCLWATVGHMRTCGPCPVTSLCLDPAP
ncbi:hypothetical protein COO60DRAFT_1531107 [Scenedesmus sp. NREL 46B-D3]|nr:hypothetical protein COO60DRAFT_1531107 [Scenedesmus sp. NREL 46B-D3]